MVTTYTLNNVMGNWFGTKVNPAIPNQFWLGLSSTEPNMSGVGATEPSTPGSGYARVRLTTLSEPENGVIVNESAVSFEESMTAWGTMTQYLIYDANSGGNLLMYGPLNVSRTVEQNTVITIKAGELEIILENPTP